jgi:hypothetical protein
MDLNYLFHRQQVERTRAAAATTEQARQAHEDLARYYEAQITSATSPAFRFLPEPPVEQPQCEVPSATLGPRT